MDGWGLGGGEGTGVGVEVGLVRKEATAGTPSRERKKRNRRRAAAGDCCNLRVDFWRFGFGFGGTVASSPLKMVIASSKKRTWYVFVRGSCR